MRIFFPLCNPRTERKLIAGRPTLQQVCSIVDNNLVGENEEDDYCYVLAVTNEEEDGDEYGALLRMHLLISYNRGRFRR